MARKPCGTLALLDAQHENEIARILLLLFSPALDHLRQHLFVVGRRDEFRL
jgi:hypothetical protein